MFNLFAPILSDTCIAHSEISAPVTYLLKKGFYTAPRGVEIWKFHKFMLNSQKISYLIFTTDLLS